MNTPNIDSLNDHLINNINSSDLETVFSTIDESITRLNKLGIAIRLSSRSTATSRARVFASQNPGLIQLDEFEDRAHLTIQNLYPHASERLRKQLADAMTDRYAKLKYEFYRVERSKKASEPPQSAPNPLNNEPVIPRTSRSDDKQPATGNYEAKKVNIVFPISSIDTTRLRTNLVEAIAPGPQLKPPKTLTIQMDKPKEPPLPKFNLGEYCIRCEWCSQMIDRSLLHTKRNGDIVWSDEGR
ncbi:hypothetical protein TWF694_011412 [Orbilia ellipsospora]|uniref:Uncharacterized protein n=1 Tax=Orbilia ellipsospora TaxID=2528407 RepID=A0AAV9X550_9PEZI